VFCNVDDGGAGVNSGGFNPPKGTEPQIEEAMGSMTTVIAKACNTG
jgi:hypothetical protein